MSLLKSKQIDLKELAAGLINVINQDSGLIVQWSALLNGTFLSNVFSTVGNNISDGQKNFVINYSYTPAVIFVFRNGIKILSGIDYSVSYNGTSFTIKLTEPVGATNGANFSETIEVLYY